MNKELEKVNIDELKNEVKDLKRVNRRIGQITDILAGVFVVSLIAKVAVKKLIKKD